MNATAITAPKELTDELLQLLEKKTVAAVPEPVVAVDLNIPVIEADLIKAIKAWADEDEDEGNLERNTVEWLIQHLEESVSKSSSFISTERIQELVAEYAPNTWHTPVAPIAPVAPITNSKPSEAPDREHQEHQLIVEEPIAPKVAIWDFPEPEKEIIRRFDNGSVLFDEVSALRTEMQRCEGTDKGLVAHSEQLQQLQQLLSLIDTERKRRRPPLTDEQLLEKTRLLIISGDKDDSEVTVALIEKARDGKVELSEEKAGDFVRQAHLKLAVLDMIQRESLRLFRKDPNNNEYLVAQTLSQKYQKKLKDAGVTRQEVDLTANKAWQKFQSPDNGDGLIIERADQIETKTLTWLWDQRIPFRKLFVGNPDQGKSLVTLYLAGCCTTGQPLYGSHITTQCEVLILSGEDDEDDTAVPRLQAAGADLTKVHFLTSVVARDGEGRNAGERTAQLDTDLSALEARLNKNPAIRLVIVDPISNYLGRTNMNKEQDVRAVLIPLRELAARLNIAIVAVMHLNKAVDASTIHRVGGAVAFTGVSRAVWVFSEDPEEKNTYRMLRMKKNIGHPMPGLKYRILVKDVTTKDDKTSEQPHIDWTGTTDQTADDILSRKIGRPDDRIQTAVQWLDQFLSEPRWVSDIRKVGEKAGHSWATLRRAKAELDIESRQLDRRWQWLKDTSDAQNSENEGSGAQN